MALYEGWVGEWLACSVTTIQPLSRSDVNLWAEDLPDKVLVVISGQDDLIHVQEVSLVLAREHVAAVFPSQMFHSSAGPLLSSTGSALHFDPRP